MNQGEKDLADLTYDMKVVAGARFAMASRLYFSANAKGFLLNGITSISIFISAGLLVSTGNKFPVDAVATALVGISIFTLWMNLDKGEGELKARADQARLCATQINDVLKRAEHRESSVELCLSKYQGIIEEFYFNHGTFDRKYAIYSLKGKYEKANSACWWTSVLPWILQCLWYPIVFAIWTCVTVSLAFLIVQ